MEKVTAEALESRFAFPKGTEIGRIEQFQCVLKIHVADVNGELGCLVTFENPLGFRVVDERDLMEYWPVCSTPVGWLFRVLSGGWLDQERTRRGSLLLDMYLDVKEYLIAGINDCVPVFSTEMPKLSGYQR
ncbi:hypothetical protein [Massilia sp. YIM B04103]|uniref:hypothetical protein n=1 Tax=Massilia sp. YIM B04103 TaxID=2963106 RepID=UPI00210D768A|nr:hypothetical protein [Massilia sp. YIM B04103]